MFSLIFLSQKALKRKANFEESKKLKERLQAYRKENDERETDLTQSLWTFEEREPRSLAPNPANRIGGRYHEDNPGDMLLLVKTEKNIQK